MLISGNLIRSQTIKVCLRMFGTLNFQILSFIPPFIACSGMLPPVETALRMHVNFGQCTCSGVNVL